MKFVKIVAIVMMVFMSAAAGAALRIKEFMNNPNPLPVVQEPVKKLIATDALSEDSGAAPVQQHTQQVPQAPVNVLVVGLDEVDRVSRTDAIALVIFDAANKSVKVASIPRDSRVYIPGRGWDKINHAYVYGGMELLRETVVNLTGVPVNYFAKVNYKSFPRIIDMLGGVDIYVEKRLHYNDYSGKLFINIEKGQQHLDGKKALHYVRFRHDPLGDIGRVQRQQKFMDVLLAKLKSPSIIFKIPDIMNEIVAAVDTDLTPLEALSMLNFTNSLPKERVRLFMAPGKAGYSGKLSYWIIDNPKFYQLLARDDPPDEAAASPVSASAAGGSEIDDDKLAELRIAIGSVRILNGDGENGLGKRASQIFQSIGIEVPYTGNAKHYDYRSSSIVYPADADGKRGAQALAELCGITNKGLIREDKRTQKLTLILGHDKETIFSRLAKVNS